MELGAFSYLSKPIKSEDLLAQVNRALRMVDVKKQRLARLSLLEKKVTQRSDELESMVRLLEYQGGQLDAVINSMGEGIMAVDNQKSIVLLNRRAEHIMGLRFADCAGLHIARAFEHRTYANQLSSLFVNEPIPGAMKNILSIAHEGKRTEYYNVNVKAITDDKGLHTGSMFIFSDQTDAILSQQMRDSFLSIAAHELRTPITVIMNYLAVIEHRDDNDDTLKEAIRDMQSANRRLMHLVNRIVTLANLSDGNYSIRRIATDIGLVVASEIGKFRPEADSRNISIVIDNRLKAPILSIDPGLLEIAVGNLIGNAIKFSRDGGAVHVLLMSSPGMKNKEISIAVFDEGEGISIRAGNNIFESFIQGENPLTRTHEGLGVGLYCAKKASELLGGNIEMFSRKEKGSLFTLHIPFHKTEAV
jgi:two-component system phosphate regulon sensor histidine kinase PhoR